jgi:hypothetical protein
MALDVGGIFGQAGLRVDPDGFRLFERRMDEAERRARNDVVGHATLDVDQRGFRRYEQNVDRIDRSHRTAERSGTRFYGSLGGAGARFAAVATGAGAAGVAVAYAGKTVVDYANDVNESLTKNEQLFGRHAAGVDRWSKGTATSIGISRKEALAAAGDYGSLFETIGLGDKPAANMSMRLTELAGDLASFNNASPQETLEALKSGLIGEAEPMRRFGALLSETRVQQEAWSSGIADNGEKLTEQQKVQARYQLILKDTNAAQGDFDRTSKGLANQLRILRANAIDLGTKIGGALLPPVLKATEFLNSLFGGTDKSSRGVEKFKDKVLAVGGPIRETWDAITREAAKLGRGVARSFEGVGDSLRIIGRRVLQFGDFMLGVFRRALPGVRKALQGVADVVRGFIDIVAGILTFDPERWWGGVRRIFGGIGKIVLGSIRAITAPAREAWARIGTAMSRPIGRAIDFIERGFRGFLDFMLGGVSTLIDLVEEVVQLGGKIPGIGGKFKGLGEDLEDTRKSIDRYRESLRKTEDEHGRDGPIRRRRRQVRELRDELGGLRRGTDEYRDKAAQLRRAEDRLSDAQRGRREAARIARRAIKQLADNVFGLGKTEEDVFEFTKDGTNSLLQEFGAKRINFAVKKLRNNWRGPGLSLNATGGMYQFGMPGQTGPDSMLGNIGGFNVAVAPGEVAAVLTRHHQAALDHVFAGMGGFGNFMAAMNTPHSFQAGGIVPIPGMPGESISSAIVGDVVRMIRQYRLQITDGYAPSGHAASGEHPLGLAIDAVPGPGGSWGLIDRAMRDSGYPNPPDFPFRWLGWNNEANHGWGNHGHWSWLRGAAGFKGAGGLDPDPPRLKITGPPGRLRSIAQGSADRLHKAADKFLDRKAASSLGVLGGPFSAGGQYNKAELARLWIQAGGPPSVAGIAAAIALAESGGNPGATGPLTSYGFRAAGLWQIHPPQPGSYNALSNARQAVAKYFGAGGFSPWEAYTNGSYSRFLQRGGLIRAQTGWFGGWGGGSPAPSFGGLGTPITRNFAPTFGIEEGAGLRDAGRGRLDRWGKIVTNMQGRIERLGKRYDLASRRFDFTEEEFVNEGDENTPPSFNMEAIRRRADELTKLISFRTRQLDAYKRLLRYVNAIIEIYAELERRIEVIIARIHRRLAGLKGKKGKEARRARENLNERLGTYKERLSNTRENLTSARDTRSNAFWEMQDTELDVAELRNELGPLNATAGGGPGGLTLPDWQAPDSLGDGGGEAGADAQAVASAAEARAAASAQALLSARAGFAQLFSPGDIGAGGPTALAAATNPFSYGGAGAQTAGMSLNDQGQLIGGAGAVIYVNSQSLIPGGPDEYRKIGEAVTVGLGYQPYQVSTIERQGA